MTHKTTLLQLWKITNNIGATIFGAATIYLTARPLIYTFLDKILSAFKTPTHHYTTTHIITPATILAITLALNLAITRIANNPHKTLNFPQFTAMNAAHTITICAAYYSLAQAQQPDTSILQALHPTVIATTFIAIVLTAAENLTNQQKDKNANNSPAT